MSSSADSRNSRSSGKSLSHAEGDSSTSSSSTAYPYTRLPNIEESKTRVNVGLTSGLSLTSSSYGSLGGAQAEPNPIVATIRESAEADLEEKTDRMLRKLAAANAVLEEAQADYESKKKALAALKLQFRRLSAKERRLQKAVHDLRGKHYKSLRSKYQSLSDQLANCQKRLDKENFNQRIAKLENETAIAKVKVDQAEHQQVQVSKTSAQLMPGLYRFLLYYFTAVLLSDLTYAAYQFKTANESLDDFADAWKLDRPETWISWTLSSVLNLGDIAWNLSLFNAWKETEEMVTGFLEKHGCLNFKQSIKALGIEVKEYLHSIKDNPVSGITDFFDFLVKFTHNFIGAAANAWGLEDLSKKAEMGEYKWFVYSPIIITGYTYYVLTQDAGYHKGKKILLGQLGSLPSRMFKEGEVARTINVMIRGGAAIGLRGFSFYFIARSLHDLGGVLTLIPPTLVAAVIIGHTACRRFGGTYDTYFSNKDTLVKLHADKLIGLEREKLCQDPYVLNFLRREVAQKFREQTAIPDATEFETHYFAERLDDMAIRMVAGAGSALNKEVVMKQVLKQATAEAEAFRQAYYKDVLENETWKEYGQYHLQALPVGSLRAGLGWVVSDHYLGKLWSQLLGSLVAGSSFVRYGSNIIVSFLSYLIYYYSIKNNALDAEAVQLFYQQSASPADSSRLSASAATAVGATAEEEHVEQRGFLRRIFTAKKLASTFLVLSAVLRTLSGSATSAAPLEGYVDPFVLNTVLILLWAELGMNQIETFLEPTVASLDRWAHVLKGDKKQDRNFPSAGSGEQNDSGEEKDILVDSPMTKEEESVLEVGSHREWRGQKTSSSQDEQDLAHIYEPTTTQITAKLKEVSLEPTGSSRKNSPLVQRPVVELSPDLASSLAAEARSRVVDAGFGHRSAGQPSVRGGSAARGRWSASGSGHERQHSSSSGATTMNPFALFPQQQSTSGISSSSSPRVNVVRSDTEGVHANTNVPAGGQK